MFSSDSFEGENRLTRHPSTSRLLQLPFRSCLDLSPLHLALKSPISRSFSISRLQNSEREAFTTWTSETTVVISGRQALTGSSAHEERHCGCCLDYCRRRELQFADQVKLEMVQRRSWTEIPKIWFENIRPSRLTTWSQTDQILKIRHPLGGRRHHERMHASRR